MFQAVAEGRIKALWIMATNPVVSLPDAGAVREALRRCDFVAVSDCEDETDLKAYAHVRLPALAWGEKNGTVTNSERRISRQRPFMPAPAEARADWWIITEVARRLGFGDAFGYAGPQEIFREHAALSGHRNDGSRLFDISGLARLEPAEYDRLSPVCWPVTVSSESGPRLFADGRFGFPDGKARMVAVSVKEPVNPVSEEYPLILNTGRVRDQWHTMTRTARSARLNQHTPEPLAEIHPQDADRYGIVDGALARLTSRWGSGLARVKVSADQQVGSVFMPMHWSETHARQAGVNSLVNPVTDPISGEPESKHTPLAIAPYQPAWHGFLMSRSKLDIGEFSWGVRVRGDGLWRHELAGDNTPASWREWTESFLGESGPGDEWVEYADPSHGRYRCALIRENRLMACLFVSRGHELPPRDWLAGLFGQMALSQQARLALLAGRPLGQEEDKGKIVCACFNVGANTILAAVQRGQCLTVGDIGARLQAGTGCGSCLPELQAMLETATGVRKAS
jgi:assimilatory nitrate reductase catalytic subunit